MTFRPSAPNKKRRWLALLAIVVLATGTVAGTALGHLADVNLSYTQDDGLANDEPGQKDLTAQGTATHDSDFYAGWKWDDISWSGKNSGDGCLLFTDDADAFVDYAVCATIGGNPATLSTLTVYSCNNAWEQRCGNPVLLGSLAPATYCVLAVTTPGQFGDSAGDTQIACNITDIAEYFDPDLTALAGASLVNTCSYPSREPNSDPSDCVFDAPDVAVSHVTSPTATTTWTATLNDRVQMTPSTAAGSVVFKLWDTNNAGTCEGLIWTSDSNTLVNGAATSVGDTGTTAGANVFTQAYSDDLVFYWTVEYTPDPDFTGFTPVCGEETTITPASVSPNL